MIADPILSNEETKAMYEHRSKPLASRRRFLLRLGRNAAVASAIMAGSLMVGVVGYRELEGLSWIDALLNASMILGAMGPVDPIRTSAGKLFASFYALYSGLLFVVVAGIILAPAAHRLLHGFHSEAEVDPGKPSSRDA